MNAKTNRSLIDERSAAILDGRVLFDQGICPADSSLCVLGEAATVGLYRSEEKTCRAEEEFKLGTPEFAARCKEVDNRSFGYRFVKRIFDVVFSLCVIAAGFLPGLLLAIAIMIDTKGSPIYSQVRVGRGGRLFRIYKFRTMVADSDDVEKYLSGKQLEQWKRERKVDGDPRITPLGRKLRHTSLDEMPNFVNVLIGDMSVIGPRAVSSEEIKWFGAESEKVLSVPAGITGYWQATSRNDATFESGERQRIELEYAKNAGFKMDARCFIDTFGAMFGKRRSGR